EWGARPLTWLPRGEPESEPLVEAAGLMLLRLPKLPSEITTDERDLVTRAGRAAYSHLSRNGEEARRRFDDLIEHFPRVPNVHYAHAIFLLGSDSGAAL